MRSVEVKRRLVRSREERGGVMKSGEGVSGLVRSYDEPRRRRRGPIRSGERQERSERSHEVRREGLSEGE